MIKQLLLSLILCIAAFAERPLGVFIPGQAWPQNCPAGFTCNSFSVTATGIPDAAGIIAVRHAPNSIGTVAFFSGNNGADWWGMYPINQAFFDRFTVSGYDLIQVKWTTPWIYSPLGQSLGQVALAVRPATVIQWIKQNSTGRCVLVGSSNGASQVAYSLAFYGAAPDLYVNVSGPPYMEIDKGCRRDTGYAYGPAAALIDQSYGFAPQTGPCWSADPAWFQTESDNSVNAGSPNLANTRVKILLGSLDDAFIKNRGSDYAQWLLPTANTSIKYIDNVAHDFPKAQAGLDAIYDAIASSPASPTPQPSPTATCICP